MNSFRLHVIIHHSRRSQNMHEFSLYHLLHTRSHLKVHWKPDSWSNNLFVFVGIIDTRNLLHQVPFLLLLVQMSRPAPFFQPYNCQYITISYPKWPTMRIWGIQEKLVFLTLVLIVLKRRLQFHSLEHQPEILYMNTKCEKCCNVQSQDWKWENARVMNIAHRNLDIYTYIHTYTYMYIYLYIYFVTLKTIYFNSPLYLPYVVRVLTSFLSPCFLPWPSSFAFYITNPSVFPSFLIPSYLVFHMQRLYVM